MTDMHSLPQKSVANQRTAVSYEYSPGFVELLQHLRLSIILSTYQAGKILVLGSHNEQLSISFLDYDRPMGIAVGADRIALGVANAVHFLKASHAVAENVQPSGRYDGCFVPHSSRHTGRILGHDLAWGSDGLWIVNTLFSCLCTLDDVHSFVPRWKPPFISTLADEDRCHLNGLAMEHGAPRYVTSLATSDSAAGWRSDKSRTGCLIDVQSGDSLNNSLCMPHSPRIRNDHLYVLNSGLGDLSLVDRRSGQLATIERLPGYTRGLSFFKQFAFIGLSRIRETNIFGGLPIGERSDLCCGVTVVDLSSGRTVATFRFLSGVEEIFAVNVIPGFSSLVFGGANCGERQQEVWVVPATATNVPTQISNPCTQHAHRESTRLISDRLQSPLSPDSTTYFENAQSETTQLEDWLKHSPGDAAAWITLGNLRQNQDLQPAAIDCYRKAIAAQPHLTAARQNLAYLLANLGHAEESREAFEELLRLDPSPLNRLLSASILPIIYDSITDLKRWRKQQSDTLQALVNEDASVDAAQQLVPTAFFFPYQGLNDVEIMANRGRVIQGRNTRQKSSFQPKSHASPDRIKIGFLSASFRNHTIGRLNIGRIEHLDRTRFHVTVCSPSPPSDVYGFRFRRAADRFIQIPHNVAEAIDTLSSLDLDVLLFADVGMDALCSTLAYSRLCHVQCVTWGHPITTGSPYMDFFLSSQLLDNPDSQDHYTEQLIRMPLLGTFYERPAVPADSSRIRALVDIPADANIYGCPQTLFKLHPDDDETFRAILEADPDAIILCIEARRPEWTKRLVQRWTRSMPHVVHRIRFLPTLDHENFLRLLLECDVLLDPLHFSGGNSSYEAFAMGTPVITRQGPFLRSRITSALYRRMRFTECIADCTETYIQLALKTGMDREYRHHVTTSIQRQSHALFSDIAEVRCFEQAVIDCLGIHSQH